MLDIFIILILAYSVAMAAYKGFVREVLGLITVVSAGLIASWTYRGVAGMFKDVVRTENLALFWGFSVIFLATVIAGFAIIWLINRFMKFAKVEWADRLL